MLKIDDRDEYVEPWVKVVTIIVAGGFGAIIGSIIACWVITQLIANGY